MNKTHFPKPVRLRRSVLCVPASNARALEKVRELDCDAVIYDLEDAVAPQAKPAARAELCRLFAEKRTPAGRETIIRINALDTPFGLDDLQAVLACNPDAVLLPKAGMPGDIQAVADWLLENDAPDSLRIWAMIETAASILNIAALAETGRTQVGRLDCFVLGLNDLRKETGAADIPGRPWLVPWLMQTLLAGRATGLDVIDSVFNDFKAEDAYDAECRQGRAMGFDGKMLIHPSQIAPANTHFGVEEGAIAEAEDIVAAFADPANSGKGVVGLNGRMIERLHLDQAERLLEKASLISSRKERR